MPSFWKTFSNYLARRRKVGTLTSEAAFTVPEHYTSICGVHFLRSKRTCLNVVSSGFEKCSSDASDLPINNAIFEDITSSLFQQSVKTSSTFVWQALTSARLRPTNRPELLLFQRTSDNTFNHSRGILHFFFQMECFTSSMENATWKTFFLSSLLFPMFYVLLSVFFIEILRDKQKTFQEIILFCLRSLKVFFSA